MTNYILLFEYFEKNNYVTEESYENFIKQNMLDYELILDMNLNNKNLSDEELSNIFTLRGYCYYSGIFEYSVNDNKAEECYRRALEKNENNTYAMHALGNLCYPTEKLSLFKKAVELNNSYAMCGMGQIYENQKDYALAYKFYQKASDMNNTNGIFYLADMYFSGTYVEKNEEKSIQLLQRAVELQDTDAMIQLGKYYNSKREFCKAMKMCTLAEKNGYIEPYETVENIGHLDYLEIMVKQDDEISTLKSRLENLESKFQDLFQLCFKPNGLVCKQLENSFYQNAQELKDLTEL